MTKANQEVKMSKSSESDAILYVIRHVIKESGLHWNDIADGARVSRATIRNWMNEKVRRPQAMTVRMVLNSLGYQMIVRGADGNETDIGPKRVKFKPVVRLINKHRGE
jgi:transcriptional regulator with XRE-family HTH domain